MLAGDAIANLALQQVGKPYVYAGEGPDVFDCSGLVCYCCDMVMNDSITCGSTAQSSLGIAVAQGSLQRGDILTYDPIGDGLVHHVGIYDGPGRMVNALNENAGVIVSDPFSAYFNPIYKGARRLYNGLNAINSQTGPAPTPGGTTPPTPTSSGSFHYGDQVIVRDGPVNIRATPSLSGTVITQLGIGSHAYVISEGLPTIADGYSWQKIVTTGGSVTGWTAVYYWDLERKNYCQNPDLTFDATYLVANTPSTTVSRDTLGSSPRAKAVCAGTAQWEGVRFESPTGLKLTGKTGAFGDVWVNGPSGKSLDYLTQRVKYTDGTQTDSPHMSVAFNGADQNVTFAAFTLTSGKTVDKVEFHVVGSVKQAITFYADKAALRVY